MSFYLLHTLETQSRGGLPCGERSRTIGTVFTIATRPLSTIWLQYTPCAALLGDIIILVGVLVQPVKFSQIFTSKMRINARIRLRVKLYIFELAALGV